MSRRTILIAVLAIVAAVVVMRTVRLRAGGLHEVLVCNRGTHAIHRLRLEAGGHIALVDSVAIGDSALVHLPTTMHDGDLQLAWHHEDAQTELHWRGGAFRAGPLLMRHTLAIADAGDVIWSSAPRPAPVRTAPAAPAAPTPAQGTHGAHDTTRHAHR